MTNLATLTKQTYADPSTLEPGTDGTPVSQFMDVPITRENLLSGELHRRFDVGQYPRVGTRYADNLIPNPTLYDEDGDGIADGISNYASPTMTIKALANGNAQLMDATGGADAHWAEIPVQPSTSYVWSVYYRITRLANGGGAVIKYELHAADDTLVTYDYHPDNALTAVPYFQQFQITFAVPSSGVTKVLPIIGATDCAIEFAYPRLEIGTVATPGPYGPPAPIFR